MQKARIDHERERRHTKDDILKNIGSAEYKHGFETQVEQEFIPKGLNEDIIRLISEKKGEPQWLLDFRLKAYRKWLTMKMPAWAHLDIPEIDFQDIIYFAAPKKAPEKKEIDPELMACRAQEGSREKGDRPRADGHFRQIRHSLA